MHVTLYLQYFEDGREVKKVKILIHYGLVPNFKIKKFQLTSKQFILKLFYWWNIPHKFQWKNPGRQIEQIQLYNSHFFYPEIEQKIYTYILNRNVILK